MGIAVESMAIELPAVKGHPNRVGFRGVLTTVDVASDRPPAGARGHRVLLTRGAAEAAIPSLLGMGLDYAPAFDRHDVRRKVGVITRAEIVGHRIEVGGFLYARDFPEIVDEIRAAKASAQAQTAAAHEARWPGTRAKRPGASQRSERDARSRTALGMSYEIADAQVDDLKSTVWVLTRVTFTGAAILRREKAAYQGTWVELSE